MTNSTLVYEVESFEQYKRSQATRAISKSLSRGDGAGQRS